MTHDDEHLIAERGKTVWFSSEEDGGPDCGISVGLGNGQSLYFGEMPNATLEEHGIDRAETGDGWWLVLYGAGRLDTRIVGPLNGSSEAVYDAQHIAEAIAGALLQSAPKPSLPSREDEPTDEMALAGLLTLPFGPSSIAHAKQCYRAMVAARPPSPLSDRVPGFDFDSLLLLIDCELAAADIPNTDRRGKLLHAARVNIRAALGDGERG